MSHKRDLFIEPPDNRAIVDFADLCLVKLTIDASTNPPTLHVYATGKDDRATILIDEVVALPEPEVDEDEEIDEDA